MGAKTPEGSRVCKK